MRCAVVHVDGFGGATISPCRRPERAADEQYWEAREIRMGWAAVRARRMVDVPVTDAGLAVGGPEKARRERVENGGPICGPFFTQAENKSSPGACQNRHKTGAVFLSLIMQRRSLAQTYSQ